MSDYKTFVVAYDFSAHADAALYAAVDLSKRFEADLHLLHVVHEPTLAYPTIEFGGSTPVEAMALDVREAAVKALENVASGIELNPGRISAHVTQGLAVDRSIVAFCEEVHADLLVIGTHGRTGMSHAFLGSVAERTLRRAPCPVLTVRGQEASEEDTSI